MPRKAFVADLQHAVATFKSVNVSKLKAGEEDGMINFNYQTQATDSEITILVPDLGAYPESHVYMFYTNSEHVPPAIHSALDEMSSNVGVKVPEMMCSIVKALDKATIAASSPHSRLEIEDGDSINTGSDTDEDGFDGQSDDDYDSNDDAWSRNPHKRDWNIATRVRTVDRATMVSMNRRIRQDLCLAKDAGFRVGHLGTLLNGGKEAFVTVSIRVAKLGISGEALQAWHLDPSHYFIILMRYSNGYRSLDHIMGQGNSRDDVKFRLGLNQKYKIPIEEAIAAFALVEGQGKTRKLDVAESSEAGSKGLRLGRLFIGGPLEELLNERLTPLIKYRMAMGFGWGGAEEFYNDHQGRNFTDNAADPRYWAEESSHPREALPSIVKSDHLISAGKNKSFPLIAMQFALRHLVRCTDFCLVCHCKVDTEFEALKPYVCSKPLCLYQYMSLGFGPSIEHEIVSQPHVVDLLISFCYASAHTRKLRNLPTGMALTCPAPPVTSAIELGSQSFRTQPIRNPTNDGSTTQQSRSPRELQTFKGKFDRKNMELVFPHGPSSDMRIHVGSWLVLHLPESAEEHLHCRVTEALLPTVRLAQPIILHWPTPETPAILPGSGARSGLMKRQNSPYTANIHSEHPPPPSPTANPAEATMDTLRPKEVEFTIYDQNFDELDSYEKQTVICMLLDTLPSVKVMKEFLQSKSGHETLLKTWKDRISPAALGILRWIIASNRSCIVQVDSIERENRKSEERVSGMPDWMQFRFAQGAPDKEQRFVTSIRKTTPDAKYPTMFAWHGSPLYNWHGIVREGLHFENADHGRAYGNGVYHALDASTSMNYSGSMYRFSGARYQDNMETPWQWPHSQLLISQAIALNEIVNAPTQFVNNAPYLVVAQLDWIQSRYLFVKCNISGQQTAEGVSNQLPEAVPTQTYEQDPKYHPLGVNHTKLLLPLNAVRRSMRPSMPSFVKTGNKKIKIGDSKETSTESDEVIALSDDTDTDDAEILFSEDDQPSVGVSIKAHAKQMETPPALSLDISRTDFVPSSLDHKSLQILEPPSFATSVATTALQRELAATLKVQYNHPLHELGWYINPELISNVYQWIVELHSFEAHLPLAQDMKAQGIKSVVLELRFDKEYPISPPFVRVIRPRFLGFMQGGGGHVTSGGALCMELLTNSGWSAVSNIESVLLQVRLAISSTDPHPARLEPGPVRDYAVGEAVDAFVRACQTHGVGEMFPTRCVLSANNQQWRIPASFRSTYASSSVGPKERKIASR